MTLIGRRSFVAGASMMLLVRPARAARTVTDSAGRTVTLPDRINHVFAAGGPASVVVYAMRPETMVGWPRALVGMFQKNFEQFEKQVDADVRAAAPEVKLAAE